MPRRAEARTRYYCREESKRLGWNTEHPIRGGQFLEEQEVVDHFPELQEYLGATRPDFVIVDRNQPILAIETKSSFEDIDIAVNEAQDYSDSIRNRYPVRVCVGIAGTPDTSIQIRVRYRTPAGWVPLMSHGYQLTQIPTPEELRTAIQNNNGTTDVRLPSEAEFYEAAIAISRMLRTAKIEEPIRPKVLGAIILALYQGDFSCRYSSSLNGIQPLTDNNTADSSPVRTP